MLLQRTSSLFLFCFVLISWRYWGSEKRNKEQKTELRAQISEEQASFWAVVVSIFHFWRAVTVPRSCRFEQSSFQSFVFEEQYLFWAIDDLNYPFDQDLISDVDILTLRFSRHFNFILIQFEPCIKAQISINQDLIQPL